MGILSVVNRNLVSNSKLSQLKYLSNQWFVSSSSVVHAPAAAGFGKAQSHALTLVGDLKSHKKLMLMIEHFHNGSGKYDTNPLDYWYDRNPPYNYSLISAEKSWKDHHNLCNNTFCGLDDYYISGSCNELMLLSFFDDEDIVREALWNPAINKIEYILPPSDVRAPLPGQTYTNVLSHAFGFDPESEDYKVLRFVVYDYGDYHDDSWGDDLAELYSLKTNSWKKIIPPCTPHRSSIHINGVYYWQDSCPSENMLSFDFANEKFSFGPHMIPRRPLFDEHKKGLSVDDYKSDFFSNSVLVEFGGSIATLFHSGLRESYPTEKQEQQQQPFSFEILVWNGESWTQRVPKITIDVPGGVFKVVGLFQDDKLYLQGFDKGELLLFDLAKRKMENLSIHADTRRVNLFPYVGSSVPFM